MYIYEEDIKEYLFEKLLAAGIVPEGAELKILAEIFFDYLIECGILNPDVIVYDEDEEEDED